MIAPEVESRYLRPAVLKDRLESSWRDGQHAWLRQPDSSYQLVSLVGEQPGEEALEQEVELLDKSVSPYHMWQ